MPKNLFSLGTYNTYEYLLDNNNNNNTNTNDDDEEYDDDLDLDDDEDSLLMVPEAKSFSIFGSTSPHPPHQPNTTNITPGQTQDNNKLP